MDDPSACKPKINGKTYHLMLKPGDVAPYVLLPDAPERAYTIASQWDSFREFVKRREFITYTGVYKGAPISVTSTGIGEPSTAIAVEELLSVRMSHPN